MRRLTLIKRILLTFLSTSCLLLAGLGGLTDASAQGDNPQSSTPAATLTPTPGPTATSVVDDVAASDLTTQQWLGLIFSFAVILVVAHFLGIFLVWILRRLTRKTGRKWDDDLLRVIRPQISWFFAALGFQIATFQLPLDETLKTVLNNVYFVLYWFVFMATAWRSIDFMLKEYSEGVLSRSRNQALSERGLILLERIARIVLIFIGAVVLLNHFGVNMLAIIAALGLGGFAIGLAAKDTIANIISGMVIMLDHPFTIGERIDVPDLETWGDVTEIGIRTTKVITRDNRQVVVPNSAIVDNNVVNYSLPDPTYRLETDIGIGAGEDVGQIVRLLKEAVSRVEGVLADKPVDILFTGFGDSSNTFRVRWWVPSFADKRRVTHQVCTTIQEVATKEGIDMPYPTYVLDSVMVHTEDGRSLQKSPSSPDSDEDN